MRRPSALVGSALRWEKGRERRVAEFGTTKQWKTLSSDEAMEQYLLTARDLEGLPFVSRENVFDVDRVTRFYVVFDVQAKRAFVRSGRSRGGVTSAGVAPHARCAHHTHAFPQWL